eukprot:scaffold3815_cov355-Prasinococcus_capsulatus_cf.AAC.7
MAEESVHMWWQSRAAPRSHVCRNSVQGLASCTLARDTPRDVFIVPLGVMQAVGAAARLSHCWRLHEREVAVHLPPALAPCSGGFIRPNQAHSRRQIVLAVPSLQPDSGCTNQRGRAFGGGRPVSAPRKAHKRRHAGVKLCAALSPSAAGADEPGGTALEDKRSDFHRVRMVTFVSILLVRRVPSTLRAPPVV